MSGKSELRKDMLPFKAPTGGAGPFHLCSLWERALALAITLLVTASPLRAHTDGAPLEPHDFWTTWSLQPSVILPLAVAVILYARGVHLAWKKAGRDRGVRTWQAYSFFLGVLALIAALVWPLDALGESLFAAHMGQHIVLMGLAAPLLVLGLPVPTIMRAVPKSCQRNLAFLAASKPWRRGWSWLTGIIVATVLQLVVFLVWHIPSAIALSLENDVVHSIMHSSLFGSALFFWTAVARWRETGFGARIFALVINLKFSLIIGGLLVFGPKAFYTSYGSRGAAWGVSLLEDQQLAGALMMTAGAMMYLGGALILSAAWFNALEEAYPSQTHAVSAAQRSAAE